MRPFVLFASAFVLGIGGCSGETATTQTPVTPAEDTSGPTCAVGSDGCPCYANATCDDGLQCASGACEAVTCAKGTDGCPCFGNQTCLDGLTCAEGACKASTCETGTEGCKCLSDGTCGGVLACTSGICAQPAPVCEAGTAGCACDAGACDAGLVCQDGKCAVKTCDTGTLGCNCLSDKTCGGGLECKTDTCAKPEGTPCPVGTLGCPCESTKCDSGLVCSTGTCASAPTCDPGSLGCSCDNGACDAELGCEAGKCVVKAPGCEKGTLGCSCLSNGTCGSGLDCVSGQCVTHVCPAGTFGCPCNAGDCDGSLVCEGNTCADDPCTVGALDCPCFSNKTCGIQAGIWLECQNDKCGLPTCMSGDEGCPCLQGGLCNAGLTCMGIGSGAKCELPKSCPAGTDGCACKAGSTCDAGLLCTAGLCAPLGCTAGAVGCVCDNGDCKGQGTYCDGQGWCQQAACQKGAEGCACAAAKTCSMSTLGEALTCTAAGQCAAPTCAPGDAGCVCGWGADCNDAGLECYKGFCQPIDCAPGSMGCRCAGGSCVAGLACRDGAICADNTGLLGGPCFDDDICETGLRCLAGSCQLCQLGTDGCACSSGGCVNGYVCLEDHCYDKDSVTLPPGTPKCWTPCSGDLVTDDGEFIACPADGLMPGCFGTLTCTNGSCLAPGGTPKVCATDLECPDFQACIQSGCYSDCSVDSDCKDKKSCVRKVCRLVCTTAGDACPSGMACSSDDGVTGTCELLADPGEATQKVVPPTFTLSSVTATFSNVSTSAKIKITNNSPSFATFTVRKRQHAFYTDTGLEVTDDPDDETKCTSGIDCPLYWLTMGEKGSTKAQQTFSVGIQPNAFAVIELGSAGSVTAPRWDGLLEVTNASLGTQSISMTYNESPEGRWEGRVYYFATFGDRDLDGWRKDKDNQVALNKVGNALVRRWGAFRVGNISFEEFQAVLQSTRNESWKWATVKQDCSATQGACYPYDINQLGLVVYTSNLASNPIPTGAVEFPIAMNLHLADPTTKKGTMSGRIESSLALQYAGDPAITLDFGAGSDPAGCERISGGACLVLADELSGSMYLGGRYETTSSDSKCTKRPDGSYSLVQTPWLVPGFARGTEVDATGLAYRYECRDSLLPYQPAVGETLTAAMAPSNMSLSLSNPVPDGRTRRRSLKLVDGALINQETMFILFEESFESFLPGDSEAFSAYGYMIMHRTPTDLDQTDGNANGTPDVYEGTSPSDTRTEPADLLGLSCSPALIKEALLDSTQTKVTSTNAAKLAYTLMTGRLPSSTEALITSASDERVHYLCGQTGLFDGGAGAITDPDATIDNNDGCAFESSKDNHYNDNGQCDDGGPDAETGICPIGTDETDCGTRKASDVDLREPCPLGSDVRFFTLDSSVTQSDVANEACQTDGSCGTTLEKWIASGKLVQLDPVWRCENTNQVYCDADRLDMRNNKLFYAKTDTAAVMQPLYADIALAFRYKTQFQARNGSTPGFTPEICSNDAKSLPYCYDAAGIEALQGRVDCLMHLWKSHYTTLQAATGTTAGVAGDLTDFLCSNYAYTEACQATMNADQVHDGFERLFSELLVMLGDEAYTKSFASRFDLVGKSPVSFEGSLFEDNGINLSGAAGYEMYSLYQAAQYYQEALDRFYRSSPLLWEAVGYGFDARNFVTPETVTRYFERLVRASTQKSRAWSEVAKRYQSFNRADLARKVVSRAYTATYIESIVLSQLMLRIVDVLQPEDRPQVVSVLEEGQRRYRMAMVDMQNVYKEISDEVRYFGLPPEYIPFPSISSFSANDTGIEVLLFRAKSKLDVARMREDGAIERNRAFETDKAEFQSELIRLRNTYENQLGDVCGTFEGPDGKIYPAIRKYAELHPVLKTFGDPCGMAGNGVVFEALSNFDIIQTDLMRVRTSMSNTIEEASIEKSRVEAQCNLIFDNADYIYEKKGEIHTLQNVIGAARFAITAIDRSMARAGALAQLGKCIAIVVAGTSTGGGTDCPAGAIAASTYGTLATIAAVSTTVLEGGIQIAEGAIRTIERDLARWETKQQCDAVMIDANARMATIVLRLEEQQVEALRVQYQVNLASAEIQQQLNIAKRTEDQLEEAEQLAVDITAARNDPNIRIYRDDAVVNAEFAFEDAIREAYRATKVLEYYTSQSYAPLEQLFLIRMVQYGDYNLQNYVTELENAFFLFEETYGLQDTRVAKVSLRDDILNLTKLADDGTAHSKDERIQMMRERLKDPALLDANGYLTIPFRTSFDELSPLTRVHKIDWIEADFQGTDLGDLVARIYLRQKGTAVIHGVTDDKIFYRFPERLAVINPTINANKTILDASIYKSLHLRDRPFVNTNWEVVINQRDEQVNKDVDLQSLTDIVLYIYYRDFTAL